MTHPTQHLLDATVYIVDDDASVREALAWMLRTRRLANESFDSATSFLTALSKHNHKYPSCLLLDVRMPHMSGLELFSELLTRNLPTIMPVIFLTGHADVPTAVDAVKRGAFDFCEKPFSNNALVDRIESALQQSDYAIKRMQAQMSIDKKLADLTEREQSVMRLVMDGLPNKLIADELSISVRTVEVHRARVFEKLNVKSAVELANLVRAKDE
jgi:two-component system, LuxR family, response regulator DctR